jgi:acyl-CoA reductase-like NAD-dependent aldehyde dehydrogenase
LTRARNIREARQAFKTGDPTNVKNQFNSILRSAAEYARQGQTEVSKLRAAETIKFIREKLQNQLVLFSRKDIREI